jgi:DoxX-like family
MFIAYIIVTALTAAANVFSATCDFVRLDRITTAMARAGVPQSWLTPLGILKTAGAAGLLIGIRVPLIGIAAATGLVLFFSGAIITHIRAHDRSYGLAVVFLALAVCSLALTLNIRA